MIRNERNELIPIRTVTGWRVWIDYRKLKTTIRKDHFPLPFIDPMLDRLTGHPHFCFLDGYSGYNQIAIAHEDQEKTTFTCPYGAFAFIWVMQCSCYISKMHDVYVFIFGRGGYGDIHGSLHSLLIQF